MCIVGDLLYEQMTFIKEKLALIADEPKLIIIPRVRDEAPILFPGTPCVKFPTGDTDHFQAIFMEILSKRWQTSDLISVMQEVQRTYPLKTQTSTSQRGAVSIRTSYRIRIEDTLSSIPRLQKTEESSQ